MSRIKRYDKSRSEGVSLFLRTMTITLLCLSALMAGFLGAAYLSGATLF
ncbi:MAG: hypothetical protein IIW23_03720 [Clostridia bacterium]|nr:hypothetical protein [Clostridia bacterium]